MRARKIAVKLDLTYMLTILAGKSLRVCASYCTFFKKLNLDEFVNLHERHGGSRTTSYGAGGERGSGSE